MSELSVGTLSGLSANNFVIDVASGSKLVQPGAVLQVVYADTATSVTNSTTTTYADTLLTASLTPTSATSKVLILVSQIYQTTNTGFGSIRLLRDSTSIWLPGIDFQLGASVTDNRGMFNLVYLDSPSTISAVTYKTQFNRSSGDIRVQPNGARSNIVLMEIAG